MDITNLEPKCVFKFFSEISEIPRESKHEDRIKNYLIDFAEKRNLELYTDEFLNVLIKKKASVGYENLPGIILQAHTDMVCVKTEDSDHDFLHDSLELIIDKNFIKARDTSLGADNGIGVATILAVLDDKKLLHPNLEALFTSEEEIGMYGAKNFDKTMLCGETLINLDGNKFGEFCIGSAGSVNLDATMPIEFVNDSSEIKFNLKISGLLSGHSGDEINKERANAIVLLGRVLLELRNNDIEIFLYDISGGLRSNLIPNNASMNFGVKLQDTDKLKNIISELKNIFHEEFADVESNIDLSLEKINLNNDKVFSKKTFDKLLARLLLIPNGVINMDVSIKDLVNTSNNLAILETCDDKIIFHLMLRSISPIRKKLFIDKINLLFNNNTKILSDNPTWNFNMSSEFINKISKIYAKKFHSTAKITAIHGGLECGYFSDRVKDMVCIGADIYDLHTVKERCEIKSVGYLWNFLREILKSK